MTETIKINDHVVVKAIRSIDPENPLTWDPPGDRAAGFGVATIACPDGLRHTYPTMQWQKDFIENFKSQSLSNESIEEFRSSTVDAPGYIGIRDWNGHQQGEWMTVVISGPNKEAAESYYQTWASWARGDVYDLRVERKCPITNSWFTSDEDEPVFHTYVDGRSLEEWVREEAEVNFEVNARMVSKRGEAILKQSELTSQIHEAKAAFANITHAREMFAHVSSADIVESAQNIFDLYDKLAESFEEQIEEL